MPPTPFWDGAAAGKRGRRIACLKRAGPPVLLAINGAEPDRVSHNNPKYHEHYYHLREFVRLHKTY